MKKKYPFRRLFAVIIMFFLTGNAFSVIVNTSEQRKEIAANFMSLLAAENYQSAYVAFNRAMKQALPPDKLKMIWTMLLKQLGPYEKIESLKVHKLTVIARCRFHNAPLNVKISIDSSGQLIGLYFLPAKQKSFNTKRKSFLSRDVEESSFEVKVAKKIYLKGNLTFPVGVDKVPAVILVHGSGPQDRDETIGPNKPFYDLAMGFAENGIVVLRYDKRTKSYPTDPSKLTVEQETIIDVVKMYEFLRIQRGIDPSKIFILGHSLGGMLIPRIAAKIPEAAGFIMFAAPARPLEDLILDQFQYISQLNPGKIDVKDIEKKVQKVKSPELSMKTPVSELPLGVPSVYWLDLRKYQQLEAAVKMTRPLLILQGGRDYQVTIQDFELWKKVLAGHRNVEFKLYPKLNHLFMSGKSKKATPGEYMIPGHVDQKVISDISHWIQQQSQ